MNKKQTIGTLLLILTLLIPTLTATTINLNPGQNHIPLGTITYNPDTPATKTITLTNSNSKLTLTLISTDNLPNTCITIISNYYNPTLNETTLVFQTPLIEPPYYFDKSTSRTIVYQGNQGRLYTLNIDYTNLTLPEDPQIALQQQINTLETNASQYQTLYVETWDQLNTTQQSLTNLENDYDTLLTETQNKTTELTTLKQEIQRVENQSMNYSANASHYKANYETVIGKLYGDYESESAVYRSFLRDELEFSNGGLYGDYLMEKQNAENTMNTAIWSVIGVFILFVIIAYYLYTQSRPKPSLTAIERDTNYGEQQYFIDNIISKGKQWVDTILHRNKTPEKETIKPLNEPHQRIDEHTQKTRIKPEITQLEKRIDSCETLTELHTRDIQQHSKKIETLETKYQTISGRVDDIINEKNKNKKQKKKD